MNENDIHKNDADTRDATECDPIPTEGTETEVDGVQSTQENAAVDDVACQDLGGQSVEGDGANTQANASVDPEISADTDPDPDPDHSSSAQADPAEQLRQLRDELKQLRAEMAQKDAFLSRMGAECEEFHVLYPQTPLSSLPDNVWKDVKQGIPLAAAYALAERRRAYTETLANSTNEQNQKCSTGALSSTENEYFTPGEVRAMTQGEVRANYQKIMLSMQTWR